MKNIYLTLFVVLTMILSTQAQLTGGGKKENTKKGKPAEKGVFDNSFYWTLTRTSATGDFADNIDNMDDLLKGKGGMGNGLGTSIGSIFYLNSIDFHEQIKLGVDVTYLSWVMVFSQNGEGDYSHMLSLKFGPIISYNPVGKLLLDARFTLQPTTMIYSNYVEDGYTDGYTDYRFISAIGSKLRLGLGMNIRYRPFTVGFEMSSGKIELTDLIYDDVLGKIGTSRFDIILGFSF